MDIKLKIARFKAGMSQRVLAEKIGVNENYISKIETGRVKPHEYIKKQIEKALKTKGIWDEAPGRNKKKAK